MRAVGGTALSGTSVPDEKIMNTYIIILQAPSSAVWEKIKERWPDRHHIWHEYAAFIAPAGITTTAQITEVLGFNEEQKQFGLVSEISPTAMGYMDSNLVEWLEKAKHA